LLFAAQPTFAVLGLDEFAFSLEESSTLVQIFVLKARFLSIAASFE